MPARIIVHFLETFGRLHVLREISRDTRNLRWFECICDCTKVSNFRLSAMRDEAVRSCGCWRIERTKEVNSTHRSSKTVIFKLWCNMHERCYNKSRKDYKYYGGRGITVCERWHDFETFRSDVLREIGARPTEKHSIDRIENSKGYENGNIRWASKTVQARNMRKNAHVKYNGKDRLMIEVCEEIGFSYYVANARRQRKWSDEDIFKPVPHRR